MVTYPAIRLNITGWTTHTMYAIFFTTLFRSASETLLTSYSHIASFHP